MKWAASIPIENAHQLASLRQLAGIEVCPHQAMIWLRGSTFDEAINLALRKLSGAQRFMLDDAGMLTPVGLRLPIGTLIAGEWLPISQYIVPQSPTAKLPAEKPVAIGLKLARSSREAIPNVLVTDFAPWMKYACEAPQVRLARLAFAVSPDGQVIIRGQPLPPIKGSLFVEECGLALLCGYRLDPDVDADVAAAASGAGAGDLVIVNVDCTVDIVSRDCFVAACRSSVRLTGKELGHA